MESSHSFQLLHSILFCYVKLSHNLFNHSLNDVHLDYIFAGGNSIIHIPMITLDNISAG